MDREQLFLRLTVLGSLGLSFLEFRHFNVLAPVLAVAAALAAFDTVQCLRSLPAFAIGWRSRAPALLVGTVLLTAFAHSSITIRSANPGSLRRRDNETAALIDWFARHTPSPGPRTGASRPEYGVLADWNLGHQLNVLAERPVVLDPFNHTGLDAPMCDVWLAAGPTDLAEAMDKYRARYLVVTNPRRNIVGLCRGDAARLAQATPGAPDGVVLLPGMERFALFRLFEAGGPAMEFANLQFRFLSANETVIACLRPDGRVEIVNVPAFQVVERRPGAIVRGVAPRGCTQISVLLRVTHAPPKKQRESASTVPVSADGTFLFRTAQPVPARETTFEAAEGYQLTAAGRTVTVGVSQQAVDNGAAIMVTWPGQDRTH